MVLKSYLLFFVFRHWLRHSPAFRISFGVEQGIHDVEVTLEYRQDQWRDVVAVATIERREVGVGPIIAVFGDMVVVEALSIEGAWRADEVQQGVLMRPRDAQGDTVFPISTKC